MRRTLLASLVIVSLGLSQSYAAVVSQSNAQNIAINFFKLTWPDANRGNISASLKYTRTETDGSADYYVFNINPGPGFVIVSADDEVMPVIAYSNEANFALDFTQTGVINWMNKAAGQIHNTVINQIQADDRINTLWSDYGAGIKPASLKSNSLGPMLSTTWNQLPYYNALCPVNPNDGQLCVTGCVATAMAQIMKYWNYPAHGTGSFSYTDDVANNDQLNIGTLSANFATTNYQWTQMPDAIYSNNTAIATLMSNCGISVAMDYSDAGSGAWVIQSQADAYFGYSGAPCAQHSYVNYFFYNPNTIQGVFESSYSASQWINLLEADMNAGHVIQYEGFDPGVGGHTWVCDGYDANDNLHMNWGWGGPYNGFYAVGSLNAGGYTFNDGDGALIGIVPLYDTACNAAASFTYHNLGGNVVQFTNTSTSNQTYLSNWTFYNSSGQFTTSTSANPQITFTGSAPYTAKLVVTDSAKTSCRDSITETVTIVNCTGITIHGGPTNTVNADILAYTPTVTNTSTEYFQATMWTFNGTPSESRDLMRFDLSAIPAGSVIVSAELNLYADTNVNNAIYGEPMYGTNNASYLYQITSAWSPNTVTWNTQPTTTTTGEVYLPQSTSTTENYLNLDITTMVQNWVSNPSLNYGFMGKTTATAPYNSMLFCSGHKADSTLWPTLNICYIPAVPCYAHASFTSQATSGSTIQFTNTSTDQHSFTDQWIFYNSSGQCGTSNAANPLFTFTGQQPYTAELIITDSVCADTLLQSVDLSNCVTFQLGNTKASDAAIFSLNTSETINSWELFAEQWTWNGVPGETRSLMRFDVSSIPPGSVISSATLSLYADTNASNGYTDEPTYGSNNACNLYQITSPWNSSTVTWGTQPTTSGTGAVNLPQSTSYTENYLNLDVSSFVHSWVNNPSSNYGMMLQMITQNYYNIMDFCSSSYPDSLKWPALTVCYIPLVTCTAHAGFIQQNAGSGAVQFTNTSTDNLSFTSQWTFYNSSGQFATSTQINPLITFTGQPPYSAQLIIVDTFCSDTTSQTVSLNNCLTFQTGSTKATGATLATDFAGQNFDFTTYNQFYAQHWTVNGIPDEVRGLLRFDLSQIPPGSVIVSAGLNLYADTTANNGYPGQPTYGNDDASYLHLVTSAWDPATVTWNTQPSASNTSEVLLPQSTANAENYLNIDISSFVQSWVNDPSTNYGMLLQLITQNYYNQLDFCSPGYADSTLWPQLNVCYLIASPCHLTASFTQHNMGNGLVQFTNTSTINNQTTVQWVFYNSNGQCASSTVNDPLISFTGQPPFSAILVLSDSVTGCSDTLQQAVNIATCITITADSLNNPTVDINSIHNTATYLSGELFAEQWTWNGQPGESRGLLMFDLSSIPTGTTILSAAVSLYADTTASNGYAGEPTYGTNNACNLQQITSPWSAASVNWNNQPTTTSTGQALLPQSTSYAENYLNTDVTSFVQSWVQSPATNYGMMLKMITGNYYNIMDFCSAEYPDSTRRPQLQVCYFTPAGCGLYAGFNYQLLGGDSVQFINTSGGGNLGYNCNWTFYNGNGVFASSSLKNPLVVYGGPAPYSATLQVVDSVLRSCEDTLSEVVALTTGIRGAVSGPGSISIFPNPNNGSQFMLKLPADFDFSETDIKIYDMLGRSVQYTMDGKGDSYCILSLQQGAPGVYNVAVNRSSGQLCGRLVVVK